MGAGGRPFKSDRPDQFTAESGMARKPRNEGQIKQRSLAERSEEGVDLTLIRWMLSLTPAGRLRAGQDFANSILRLRGARIQR